MSSSSSTSSLPSLDVSVSSNNTNASAGNNLSVSSGKNSGHSISTVSRSPAQQRQITPDFYIIRVTLETDLVETDGKSDFFINDKWGTKTSYHLP